MYHSIDGSGSALSVSPDRFEEQMRQLAARGCAVRGLGTIIEALRQREERVQKLVGLTFDDGYRNNYELVFPVLQKCGFQATFFVVTGLVGKQVSWWSPLGLTGCPLMSWREVEGMVKHGMEIGAHTRSHLDLTRLSLALAREEIRSSKLELEDRLQRPVAFFAYPYGKYDARVAALVEAEEFRGAVTTELGFNGPQTSPYRLKRIRSGLFGGNDPVFALLTGKWGPVACTVVRCIGRGRRWMSRSSSLPAIN